LIAGYWVVVPFLFVELPCGKRHTFPNGLRFVKFLVSHTVFTGFCEYDLTLVSGKIDPSITPFTQSMYFIFST
jgi:hypothetical protein